MATPVVRKLKKGELLFNEGDPSKAMYFVMAGTIRLFKKKGASSIELGMIHKGEVIGEMGFLDGGPRSASAEAIHDTDLTEITNTNLAEQLKILPPWLMVLLKTIVNRLRSANNKIRQLESTSTSYTYGSEGVSTSYQFLSTADVLKICTSLLLVGSRNAEAGPNGMYKCAMTRINRYANQVMGIHVSKVTEMIDILERVGLAKVDRTQLDKVEVYLSDLGMLENLILYVNEENLKEHSKKIELTIKAVAMMGYIVKHIELFPPDGEGIATVNLARIIEIEKNLTGKDPFRLDETIDPLVKHKLATELKFKDGSTVTTQVHTRNFFRLYRIQKVLKEVDLINEQKREQAARGAISGKR
jgi:CRP-like cAMP-binding protein